MFSSMISRTAFSTSGDDVGDKDDNGKDGGDKPGNGNAFFD